MASIVVAGDTSGTVTLTAPAVAGTTTLTLPTVNGTVLTNASSVARSQMPAGSIIQCKAISSTSNPTTSSTSFVSTGISWTFDQALRAGSQVYVAVNVTAGSTYSDSWAGLFYITIVENSINRGDSNFGIAASAANLAGNVNSAQFQYDVERMGGSCIFTPSNSNPTIELWFKTFTTAQPVRLNSNYQNGSADYRSCLTGVMMEIAA